MQAHSDLALLQQWRQHQDAHAFRTLTQRYGGLVFGVCNRVLKNPSDAEEITQDCFLKLARHPEKVNRAVGPWLHSVAVNAAIGRMRSEHRRRAREAVYLKDQPSEIEYSARDLLEHVDEAIHQLPEAHRHCVVAWFLEGKPRHEVAEELGVSTKTIQRKTDEAIEKIRDFLGQRGITTSAVALGAVLTGLKADAMPLALDLALGKIAVAGNLDTATRAAAVQVTTIGGTGMIKATGITAALVAVVSGIAWWSSTVPAKERVAESIPVRTLESSAATAPTIETPSKASTVESEATTEAPNGDSSNPAPLGRELFDITPITNPTRYASLRGTVTDSAERPIAGATITLVVAGLPLDELASVQVEGFPPAATLASSSLGLRRQDAARDALFALPDHRHTTQSDEHGQFLIEGIRYRGHAMIGVEADGYTLTQQGLTMEESFTSNVDVALTSGITLLGRLVTPSGEPISDARVGVYAVKVTAPDPIPVIPLGGETSISNRAGGSSSGSDESRKDRASGRTSSSGDNGDRRFGGGGFGVGGFATGSGGNISLGAVNRSAIIPAFQPHTDDSGHFSWTAAAAGGKLAISLVADSITHGTATFTEVPVAADEVVMLEWESGVAAIDGHILLSSGEPAKEHYVHLRGTIEGGISPDGAMKGIQGVSGSEFFLATDGDGRFHRAGIAAHESFMATIYDSAGRKRGSVALPAFDQGETLTWSHTLSPPLKVTGTVLGIPSGKPVVRALVYIHPLSTPQHGDWEMEQVSTNALGGFTLDFAGDEGEYIVNATVSPWWDEKAGTKMALRYGTTPTLNLEIPDPWQRTFRLVEPGGTPVPGVTVVLEQSTADGGRTQYFMKSVTSDRNGRMKLRNLAPGNSTTARFSLEGYLDGKSAERAGAAGERCAEEVITLYPRTGFAARLVDEAGQPLADEEAVVLARYGDGEELIYTVATDYGGWLVLDRHLPATSVSLEIRLMAEQEPNPDLSRATYGPMPDHYRLEILRHFLRTATLGRTPYATLPELTLEASNENEIGDLVLKADQEPGEE